MNKILIFLVLVIIIYVILAAVCVNICARTYPNNYPNNYIFTNPNYKIVGAGVATKDLTKYPRSKQEAYIIKLLEDITGKSFPTVRPDWLKYNGKNLELDGYNSELNIALEFGGPLHTKWQQNIEPYEKYLNRIKKDQFKVETCAKNGVDLIVINYNLPKRHWKNYLLSRLYDLGYRDRPINYIELQTLAPWTKNVV